MAAVQLPTTWPGMFLSPTTLSSKQWSSLPLRMPIPSSKKRRMMYIRNAELEPPLISRNNERRSNNDKFLSLGKTKMDVKLGFHHFISNSKYLFLLPLICFASSTDLPSFTLDDVIFLWSQIKLDGLVTSAMASSALVGFLASRYITARAKGVYLVDFSCYKPDPAHKSKKEVLVDMAINSGGSFTKENVAFQRKILDRSGIGQESYLPSNLTNPSLSEARKEAESVMFGSIDELLEKTGVKAKDIGILVVNCSLFNPTPSLAAMIVNHYKLRSDIKSYNLGGMGCSAGIISIDLANQLLQVL